MERWSNFIGAVVAEAAPTSMAATSAFITFAQTCAVFATSSVVGVVGVVCSIVISLFFLSRFHIGGRFIEIKIGHHGGVAPWQSTMFDIFFVRWVGQMIDQCPSYFMDDRTCFHVFRNQGHTHFVRISRGLLVLQQTLIPNKDRTATQTTTRFAHQCFLPQR